MSFVQRLTEEQVDDFVKNHLKEDFDLQFGTKWRTNFKVVYDGEKAVGVRYSSKSFQREQMFALLNDRIEPMISRKIEKAWVQYMYSIFGEEYKTWYLQEKDKMFKE